MSLITFSLAISHTPWIPERVASMKRLQDSLNPLIEERVPRYEVFSDKEPNFVWSEKMWFWASGGDTDWCVFLQDDAVVAPDFFERLTGIIQNPNSTEVIGLQVAHPVAVPLSLDGCAGFTTNDALVGVGYAMSRSALKEFLYWRRKNLKEGAVEAITEDSLIGLWCAVAGRKIYHPIPTIVDHDTSLASTFGNEGHVNRRSRVRWDTPGLPEAKSSERPHMGCFYPSTPHVAKEWVKDFGEKPFRALLQDNGAKEAKRLNYARRGRGVEPKARIFIATPTRGGVHAHFASSVWQLLQDESIDAETSMAIDDVQLWGDDLVRVRSRMVSYFLNQTDCTHLLFLDSDIEVLPKVIRGMLAADKGFVACPYPRREGIDFKRVRENTHVAAEGVAYRYSVRLLGDTLTVETGSVAKVEAMPLGCALISREGLQELTNAHPELAFDDAGHGPSVALFQLILKNRALLSEDYSFCTRYKVYDDIWMFLGEGSPVNHYGDFCFRGSIEAFGLRRGL